MKQMKHSFKRAMAIMLSILLIKGSKFKSGKVTNAFVGAGKRRKIICSGWISAILYMDFYAVPEG